MYIFSFCSLDSAVIFHTINADDIETVQNFIRTTLHEILQLKYDKSKATHDENFNTKFFGKYAKNPSQFVFSRTDIAIIHLLSEYVGSVIDDFGLENGLNHFRYRFEFAPKLLKEYFDHEEEIQSTNISKDFEALKEPNAAMKTQTHEFLNKLTAAADRNATRKKPGFRHDDDICKFATYLRLLSGPLAYQTLHSNIPLALPSLSSVNRYISKKQSKLIEGHLRVAELSQYLEQRNLPRVVVLQEDATRINGKVNYHSKTNQLLGFVLPLDNNGMPIPHSFPARNFDEIYEYFSRNTPSAHFVNVIMAQPLANAPAFCLMLFSSNAQYTAEDVANRWRFITKKLAKADIHVLVSSTDSDPKYNSAMRKCSRLGFRSKIFHDFDWFSMDTYDKFDGIQLHFIQDSIHIATKLRNLILKTLKNIRKLPFGPKSYIQIQHLTRILQQCPKDLHRLTETVLNPIDRMNFESVLRICDDMVLRLLASDVPDSGATIQFLRMIRDIIESFTDIHLTPLQRIYKIWCSVFVLRIWRNYIESSKRLTLEKNFLSNNCYTCIEINAHSLVLIMLNLQRNGQSHLFIPNLFESQACESIFRQIRSLVSVFCTVTNGSVRDIIDRINRIELQSEIIVSSEFKFPRLKKEYVSDEILHELPSKEQIISQIEHAKDDAIKIALRFKLIKDSQISGYSFKCKLAPLALKPKPKSDDFLESTVENEPLQESSINKRLIQPERLMLKNYADDFVDETIPENSPFVEISGCRNRKVVKKCSLVWMLRNEANKLSSDRLRRVMQKSSKRNKSKTTKPHFNEIISSKRFISCLSKKKKKP